MLAKVYRVVTPRRILILRNLWVSPNRKKKKSNIPIIVTIDIKTVHFYGNRRILTIGDILRLFFHFTITQKNISYFHLYFLFLNAILLSILLIFLLLLVS